ncbi:hypothetical protein HK096_008659 [Nowakowskiella sp. JEL0078]|nr:hypothetical protein HK096_008659 [Nowakowskiella sp. JEL0078]
METKLFKQKLPPEIIDEILCHIPTIRRFRLSTLLNRRHLQASCLLSLAKDYEHLSLDGASKLPEPQALHLLSKWSVLLANSSTPRTSFIYSNKAMDIASATNKLEILKWWCNSGLSLRYTSDAIDFASNAAHIRILNWWRLSELQLKYSPDAINKVAKLEYPNAVTDIIATLEWWRNSKLDMKFDSSAMDFASGFGHVAVLQWWKDNYNILSGIKDYVYFSQESMRYASRRGHVEVLEWWKGVINEWCPNHESKFLDYFYDHQAIDNAAWRGNTDVLEWWLKSGLPLEYRYALDKANEYGHAHVLEWWQKNGLTLCRSDSGVH